MAFEDVQKVWMNGKLVDFADAKIHVFSHVVHYGSGVFEGTRCYETERGPAVFRLRDHTDRLFASAKIYRMEIPYAKEKIEEAVLETIRANGFDACYIRPVVYRGMGTLGVNPFNSPIDVAIGVWKWGKYLGPEALENGVDACVSSWNRMAPNTFPAMAKATANYMNSQLIKMEALTNGYVEGIGLSPDGTVAEGSGENIFLAHHGRLITPTVASAGLPGITRTTVIRLAHDCGIEVVEQVVPREMLYIADEVFFCGTASEITPIRSVDRIPVGSGTRGPIVERLQKEFFSIVEGRVPDRHGWLTPVGVPERAAARA
ncbi:MAG TPA: branched-chain amino acid transaminase [Thermoanaerobaculia bacterium]|nr:branched-chain amino acid transaminase [Thermoanaerobaculia bacterium]